MQTRILYTNAVLLVLLIGITVLGITTHPAFALKNFFACITDISNRDGGDHNLTAQQVLNCFHKEFPSNDQSISHSSSTIDTIINGHHFHSQILN